MRFGVEFFCVELTPPIRILITMMDVKQAVQAAKKHLLNVFEAEISEPPSLEEVWQDARKKEWCVTLGIRRGTAPLAGLNLPEYKTVRIKLDDGSLVSIRSREFSGL